MTLYAIEVSEETEAILFTIAQDLKLPDDLTDTEKLEFVIDTMANSIDTRTDVVFHDEGKPLEMKDAMDAILNPNISSIFKAPDTGAMEHKTLTFDQVSAILPLLKNTPVLDDITKRAITIVFNKLPQDEWVSAHAARLVDQTIALLNKQAEQKEGDVGWQG